MKRITSSILAVLAAAALYSCMSAGVQAAADTPSAEMKRLDVREVMNRLTEGRILGVTTTLKWLKAVGPISKENELPVIKGEADTRTESAVPAPKDLKLYYLKGQVQLGWTPQQGETYNVYFSEQPGGQYKLLPMGMRVSTGAYTISNMRRYEPTFYVVEAVNGLGKSGYSNEVSSSPNKVTGLKAMLNEDDESIRLTWTDPQEGMEYHIYYVGPDGMLSSLNDEPVKDREYVIPNQHMLSGLSGKYALHVIAVNDRNLHSEPSQEVTVHVNKYPSDRITITDPSVAWPSEDSEDETVSMD